MPIHDWTRVEPGIFHDFHHEWISTIKRALNDGLLPGDYYALAEQIAGGFEPDVLALERSVGGGGQADKSRSSGGGIALATAPPKVRYTAQVAADKFARKKGRIVVRHASDDRVVALVEIVSPGNKDSRHAIRAFVAAGIHLLIVDLFPPSARDPRGIHAAVWSEMVDDSFDPPQGEPLTLAAYRAGDQCRAFVEPAAVGRTLASMPLFLEPEIYVAVPLEATYLAAFEGVPRRWREVLEAT